MIWLILFYILGSLLTLFISRKRETDADIWVVCALSICWPALLWAVLTMPKNSPSSHPSEMTPFNRKD